MRKRTSGVAWGFVAVAVGAGVGLAAAPAAPPAAEAWWLVTAASHGSVLEQHRAEGVAAFQRGELREAERLFREGLERAERDRDDGWTARFLNNLGIVYKDLEQFDPARNCFIRTLALRQALGSRRGLPAPDLLRNQQETVSALVNLGNVFFRMGQYEKALTSHSRARDLLHDFGHRPGLSPQQARESQQRLAAILIGMGNVYGSLGQWEKALSCHTRAAEIRQAARVSTDETDLLNNLANAYAGLGQWAKARQCLERALVRDEAGGNRYHLAGTLNNLGNICAGQGDLAAALAYYNRALKLREALGHAHHLSATLVNVGAVYSSLRLWREAEHCYSRALKLLEPLRHSQEIALIHSHQGYLRERQGHLDEAEAAYARAVREFEAVSAQVGEPSQMGAFQDAYQGSLYARYAALMVRRGRRRAALAMAERGRAQGLARQLALNQVDLSGILTKADAGRLRAGTAALTAAGKRLATLLNQPPPDGPALREAWQREQQAARQARDEAEREHFLLRESLFARYPALGRLHGQRRPSIAQLTALADRHPDTLFLEWVTVDDTKSLLFALSRRDGVRAFSLPVGRKKLQSLVAGWREKIILQEADEPRAATGLYRALLGSLEANGLLRPGRHARLVLAPDGALGLLPWAALRDGAGRRLIERYPLAITVSLSVLTWPGNPRRPWALLLCAADPTGEQGERMGAPVRAARRDSYPPLPYAREEALQVAALFPGALDLAGVRAREAAVKQRISQYRVLHFATHGILDRRDGLRSSLLMAHEPLASPEDGRLEAREIVGLPLAADLAVLSACHTGEGKVSRGEGPLGFAWAFRAAGCRSVVASLWAVGDRATGQLVVAFYRGLKAGRRQDEALRAAMLSVRRSPAHNRPLYWAAFQVFGDAAPLGRLVSR